MGGGALYAPPPPGQWRSAETPVKRGFSDVRYLFIYLFISTYNDIHMYDSGYYVEVKDDDDKNYYWKETDKDKEGWLKWVGR